MRGDMGGAAAVLGAMVAIAALRPAVEVIGVIAAAENMVSGAAMRPGDVVRTGAGKTIEVGNTDAGGTPRAGRRPAPPGGPWGHPPG